MRTNTFPRKLAIAGLLAAASAFTAPAAFADDHGRGPDHGHYQNGDHRGPTHDMRHDGRDRAPPSRVVVRDNHVQTRVVYRQPVFYRGRAVPVAYRHAIQPVPAAYRYRVPPAPRGYAVGYYAGYTVVYDPATYLVLSVIDLLANG